MLFNFLFQPYFERSYKGRNIWDDPIIEKSQDQGQGQGQDHLLPQRAALPQFLVLALTLTLVLVLRFFNYRVVPDIPSLINSLELLHCPKGPEGLKHIEKMFCLRIFD